MNRRGRWALGAGVAAVLVWFWVAWWPTRPRTVAMVWTGTFPAEGSLWLEWPLAGTGRAGRVWTVGDVVMRDLEIRDGVAAFSVRLRPDQPPREFRVEVDPEGNPRIRRTRSDGSSVEPGMWRRHARVRERRIPAGWRWRGWGAHLATVVRWPEPVASGGAVRVARERMAEERRAFITGTRRGIWTESLRRLFRRQPEWERTSIREWQVFDAGPNGVGLLRRDQAIQGDRVVSSGWAGQVATPSGLWVGKAELGRFFRDDVDWQTPVVRGFDRQLAAQGLSGSRRGMSVRLEERLTGLTWADGGLVLLEGSASRSRPLYSGWWGAADLEGLRADPGLLPWAPRESGVGSGSEPSVAAPETQPAGTR